MHPSSREGTVIQLPPGTVVLMVTAAVLGAAAGALTYCASHSLPQTVLATSTAAGGSFRFFWQIFGPGRPLGRQRKENGTGVQDDVEETLAVDRPAGTPGPDQFDVAGRG